MSSLLPVPRSGSHAAGSPPEPAATFGNRENQRRSWSSRARRCANRTERSAKETLRRGEYPGTLFPVGSRHRNACDLQTVNPTNSLFLSSPILKLLANSLLGRSMG
jgi:hypothetical protein